MLSQNEKSWQFMMAGIPVRIMASNLLICGILGLLWGMQAGFLAGAVIGLIFFVSIFLHECGHAFMAKARGVKVLELQLNGMGGFVRHPGGLDHPTAFLITLAGPLATLAIVVFGFALEGRVYVQGIDVFAIAARINLLLFIFNMLPMVPLDGGLLLHRFLWMLSSSSKDGKIVPIKRWKKTPDQIVGQIGVIAGYLWIPLTIWIFLRYGILFFFMPPIGYSRALAEGRATIPL